MATIFGTPTDPSIHKTTKTILLINGPNLNLLGYREPSIYGSTKLADIESHLRTVGQQHSIAVQTFQSNHEGAIVDRMHEAFWANLEAKAEGRAAAVDAIIINPGAFTHTSVAIRDALAGVSIPFIECHISNVHAREAFRHKSFLSEKAEAVIAGLGVYGYVASLEYWNWKWKGGKLDSVGQ